MKATGHCNVRGRAHGPRQRAPKVQSGPVGTVSPTASIHLPIPRPTRQVLSLPLPPPPKAQNIDNSLAGRTGAHDIFCPSPLSLLFLFQQRPHLKIPKIPFFRRISISTPFSPNCPRQAPDAASAAPVDHDKPAAVSSASLDSPLLLQHHNITQPWHPPCISTLREQRAHLSHHE